MIERPTDPIKDARANDALGPRSLNRLTHETRRAGRQTMSGQGQLMHTADGVHVAHRRPSSGPRAFFGLVVQEQLEYGWVWVRHVEGYPWDPAVINQNEEPIKVFVGVNSHVRGPGDGYNGDVIYCIENGDPNVWCEWVGLAFLSGANYAYPLADMMSPTQDAPEPRF